MQKLWLQLLILAILLAHSSGSPQRLDFILQPLASTHPVDQTARALLGARSHVALGRATVYTLPGACSYSVSATSESPAGLIDVALAPKQRWEACSACQKDLREDEVLCTSVHSCNATVGALDASHDYALVVGRVGLGRGTDETVRVHVTGTTATCPGGVTKLLRVAPGQVQGRRVPYVSDAILPRDDPGCPPGARLCWLHDHKARLLLEGAAKCGYTLNGAASAVVDGIRGLAATRDIPTGAVVLSIPRSAALEVSMTRNESSWLPPDLVSPEFWAAADSGVRLALVLIAEKRLGSMSPRASWIAALPRTTDAPWRWLPADLLQLHYAPLQHKALEQRAEWKDAFHGLQQTTPGTNITSTEFYWALEMVKSRAFWAPEPGNGSWMEFVNKTATILILLLLGASVGERYKTFVWLLALGVIGLGMFRGYQETTQQDLCIVPAIDMANHAASLDVVNVEAGWHAFYMRFQATATQPIAEGAQVWNHYGPRNNDNLLQWYGFVADANPFDTYTLEGMVGRVRALQHVAPSRLQLLSDQGLQAALDQVVVTRAGFPNSARPALRLLFAPPEVAAGSTAATWQQPLPEKMERHVNEVMIELLKAERDSKLTTLQEDMALQGGPDAIQMGPRMALALQFRIQKKKLLADAISAMEAMRE